MEHTSTEDPTYHAAVVDLLGVLAYGELTAFIRMAVDSDLAPTLLAEVGDGRPGEHRVRPVLRARRAHALPRHRPRGRDGAVRRALRGLPRADQAQGLDRGARQGVRRRRHREGLLSRDVGVRRRGHEVGDGAGARRRRAGGVRRGGRARHPQDRPHRERPARPVGAPAARRGAVPGPGRGRGARRHVGAARRGRGRTSARWGRCSPASPTTTSGGWPASGWQPERREAADPRAAERP